MFLFRSFEIKTTLSSHEVLDKVNALIECETDKYYGRTTRDGFFMGENSRKYYMGGSSQNSFAPVAKATVSTENGVTTVAGTIRMHLIVLILFAPVYLVSLILILPCVLIHLLLHFCFFKPAKRLEETLEYLLS